MYDLENNLPAKDHYIELSMAISLKRIADALEKLTKVPTMPELTPEQEEEMLRAAKTAGFIIMK
jgi:hypothetical protein